MRYARPVTFAVLASLGLAMSGCRTAGVDNLARRDTGMPRPTVDARAIITAHNRNAERIESLEAKPNMVVTMGRGKSLPVIGNLELERPRNFSMAIRAKAYGEVADIGSNEEKFWFWVRDNQDKAVYFCNHEDVPNTPLAAALQPDWIVEALGLRVIPEEELGELSVKRSQQNPDSLVLTHRPTKSGRSTVVRMTVISESTHEIKEHRIYEADGKTLLARAVIDKYMKLEPPDSTQEEIYIPAKLKLEWIREKLSMEVTFSTDSTTVNPEFTQAQRDMYFVQEGRTGYAPRNLASGPEPPGTGARSETRIRETRPAPPAGVELGRPEPDALGVDGAMRTDRNPLALSADPSESRSLRDRLAPPPMARAPDIEFARPANTRGWQAATAHGSEN